MTTRRIQKLREKVQKEKEEYTKDILSLSKEEILQKAYEITIIEEFFLWFEGGGIDYMMEHIDTKGEIFRKLENTPNLLKTLREKEAEYDIPMSHDWDNIEKLIKDFVVNTEDNDAYNSRKEVYAELISMGYKPEEAWEQISEMDFAEDYEERRN